MNIKNMKRILYIVLPLLIVLAVIAFIAIGSTNTVSAECNALSDKFKEYGVAVEDCEFNAAANQIKVSFKSSTASEQLTADDINTIRSVRNGVRYEMNTLKTLSGAAGYNEVMTNSAGKVLLDSDIDLQTIPPFPECAELRENIPDSIDIEDMCKGLISEYSNITLSTSYDNNIGKTLQMVLDYDDADFDAINQDVADIMRYVDSYNQDSAAVQQTEITVYAGGEKVLFSSSDLVYRDFLWWQTPQMSDTWTHY